jgi:predicted O-methyltransferase YrrM
MNSITVARLKELEKTADDFWNVSHQTGNFISMLIKATNTKNVLEIGTSNGYSGLWIADALKTTGGHLTTLEFWEKRQCLAREYFAESGLSDIATFKIGQAYDIIMDELQNETYDLVFIDADKRSYSKYYDIVFDYVRPGGLIVADDVLWSGKVLEEKSHYDSQTQGILDFNEKIMCDERVEKVMLPVRHGLYLIRKI